MLFMERASRSSHGNPTEAIPYKPHRTNQKHSSTHSPVNSLTMTKLS